MVNEDYQVAYFKYMIEIHQSLVYDIIVLELVENYKVKQIKNSKKQFSNFKNRKNGILNAEIYKEELLSNIKLYNINLQKFFIIYCDENTKIMKL